MPDPGGLPPEHRETLLEAFSADYSPFVRLAQRIGRRQLEAVLQELGGLNVYVPSLDGFYRDLHRGVRNREICRRFNGRNLPELADEFDLSERQLRTILREEMKQK